MTTKSTATAPVFTPGATGTVTVGPNPPTPIAGRKRMTNAEFKSARAQALATTGYDATSPIWGKRLDEVCDAIAAQIQTGTASSLNNALTLVTELKRRTLTNRLIGQAKS
jgi:hypothetical protein